MKTLDIAVIGGGASGLAAAISAAQTDRSLSIAVLERAPRVGRKLLSTGNGRCNLTNLRAAEGGYHGDEHFARQVISHFPPRAVLQFFHSLGVRTHADDEGRVYPLCNQAAAVLDAVRLRATELGIAEICNFDCSAVQKQGNLFLIKPASGESVRARRVIVCAGGMAAPKIGGTDAGVRILGAQGHALIPCRPALTQIDTDIEPIHALKGLRYQGGVALLVDGRAVREEQGEILFAESGLSGIAVMQLSRAAGDALRQKKRVAIRMQILPDRPESLSRELFARAQTAPNRELNDFLTGLVAKRIGQSACKQVGAVPLTRLAGTLNQAECAAIARILTGWTLRVRSVKGFDSAQVTAGGADLRGFDPATMQSRNVGGLYAAGEVLDIDGDCGGYNLQWAWASGLLAGQSAAESLAQ